jgi:hypothetical protein
MITTLTMPEDPAAVPAWLDRQLLGPGLPQLVAEHPAQLTRKPAAQHAPVPPPATDNVQFAAVMP